MNTKTMEGLVGASTNIKNMDTPMRVFRDARRRGDISVMKRAMGYAADYAEEAYDYYDKAEKGMEEDAKEAREKAEKLQEKAIEKRREERKKQEEKLNGTKESEMVEISMEGKELLEENPGSAGDYIKSDPSKKPVLYTREGTEDASLSGGEIIDIAITEP